MTIDSFPRPLSVVLGHCTSQYPFIVLSTRLKVGTRITSDVPMQIVEGIPSAGLWSLFVLLLLSIRLGAHYSSLENNKIHKKKYGFLTSHNRGRPMFILLFL